MINIKGFHPDDVKGLGSLKGYYASSEAAEARLKSLYYSAGTHMRTISDENGILAVVGATLHWKGNMEVWSVTTTSVFRKPLGYTKAVLSLLVEYQRKFEIKRFHAACLCGYPELEKWFTTIGFKKESTMKSFGPNGEDFFLMVRMG